MNKLFDPLNEIVMLGYQKVWKLNALLAGRQRTVIRAVIIGKIKFCVKKTLPITHCHWFLSIDTEYFCNVIAVQLKIGDHSQLVKALQGHQKDETY